MDTAISARITENELRSSLESLLTTKQRRTIAVKLLSVFVGGGLLLVGVLYKFFFPDQRALADVVTLIAATIVSVPVLVSAARGFVLKDSKSITDQLVAAAILAGFAIQNYEVVTLVPLLMVISHFFEERSVLGARQAVENLRKLHEQNVRRILPSGELDEVEAKRLNPGEVVRIFAGERIQIDGVVQSGRSTVDQSSVTGESLPVTVMKDSGVFAGGINLSGMIDVRVTGIGKDTAIGKIFALMKNAEESKPRFLRLLERYSASYLPLVMLVALLVLLVSKDIQRAMSVLIVACPVAFVLASPGVMIAALSIASKNGVLIKNTRFLEVCAEVKNLILDKTGTVTYGKLAVSETVLSEDFDQRRWTTFLEARKVKAAISLSEEGAKLEGSNTLVALASLISAGSRHPVSFAVTEEAAKRGLKFPAFENIEEIAGCGLLSTDAEGRIWRFGRASWLRECEVEVPELRDSAGSKSFLSVDKAYLGGFFMLDHAKTEVAGAIEKLRGLGIERAVLLTGDRKEEAERIGRELALDAIIPEVLPEEKLAVVNEEKKSRKTMMVGDGINDALALSAADVGVALPGRGADISLQSADLVLLSENLSALPFVINLARKAHTIIAENVLVGVGFSVTMLILASLGYIHPLVGALLHNVGAIFVVFNSARLLRLADRV
ncbi:MAG: cation-translocating P-type ATPase [Planctomycetes bacterium]|nr:cation-translocating P-type ATPase [Planctomycetota bacterium]